MNTLAPLPFIHLAVGALHRLRQRLAAAVVGRPAHADLHVVGQFGGGRRVADGLLERVDEVLRARLAMETDEGGKLVAAVAAADAADAAAEVGQGVRHNAEGFVALQVTVAVVGVFEVVDVHKQQVLGLEIPQERAVRRHTHKDAAVADARERVNGDHALEGADVGQQERDDHAHHDEGQLVQEDLGGAEKQRRDDEGGVVQKGVAAEQVALLPRHRNAVDGGDDEIAIRQQTLDVEQRAAVVDHVFVEPEHAAVEQGENLQQHQQDNGHLRHVHIRAVVQSVLVRRQLSVEEP